MGSLIATGSRATSTELSRSSSGVSRCVRPGIPRSLPYGPRRSTRMRWRARGRPSRGLGWLGAPPKVTQPRVPWHTWPTGWCCSANATLWPAGRPADASDLADRALALARGQHERPNEALGLRLRAEVAAQFIELQQKNQVPKDLAKHLPVGYEILPGRESRYVVVKSSPELTGSTLVDARVELGEASQLFRSMEMRMGLARADAGLAALSR